MKQLSIEEIIKRVKEESNKVLDVTSVRAKAPWIKSLLNRVRSRKTIWMIVQKLFSCAPGLKIFLKNTLRW